MRPILLLLMLCANFTNNNLNAQCALTEFTIDMSDDFGDGWTGNQVSIKKLNATCGQETIYGPFSLDRGPDQQQSVCLPDGCYYISTVDGDFKEEISWSIRQNSNQQIWAEHTTSHPSNLLVVGNADCSFIGCTDQTANNYDPNATCSIGSCQYLAVYNDICDGAMPLECGATNVNGSTENATAAFFNNCKANNIDDVWYSVYGTGEEIRIEMSTQQANSEIQLTVFTTSTNDCSSPLVCNSNTSFINTGANKKMAIWDSEVGTIYFVNVGFKQDFADETFTLNSTCPDCGDPVALTADYVTENRAMIDWKSASSMVDNCEVWVCPSGVPYTDPACRYLDNQHSPMYLNNLFSCYDYDVYLRERCNSTLTNVVGPLSFTTDNETEKNVLYCGDQMCYPMCAANGQQIYSSSEDESWTFCADAGMYPSVTFNYVDMELSTNCIADFIEISSGIGYSGPHCGSDFQAGGSELGAGDCYYNPQMGGCLQVSFKSNASVEAKGFCMEFVCKAPASVTNCNELLQASVPLKMLSFDAEAKDGMNVIQWETSNEYNVDLHRLERSTDGHSWKLLVEHKALNAQEGVNQYLSRDLTPFSKTYYRLKTIDFDGSTYHSEVRIVQRDKQSQDQILEAVYPNPSSGVVFVQLNESSEDDLEIVLIDMAGKETMRRTWSKGQYDVQLKLDLTEIQTGIYFIRAIKGTYQSTQKLIISN